MSVPGAPGVNPAGAFNYSVPINVPPGTGGVVPGLALTYSSQAADGFEGLGWSLSGLAQITRCPRTMANDGVHGSVNFDANDRFCLNGEELVAVSGTYGADGTVYRLLADDFTQITSHGTVGSGPSYFTVQLRSGITMEMGNTSSSRFKPLVSDFSTVASSVSIWAVDKISDPSTNYMTVTYINDTTNGQLYPSEIDYTGNTNSTTATYNSVQFTYMSRSADIVPLYRAGTVTMMTKLLTHIKTYAGASVITDYQLAYNYASTGASHNELATFKQCDSTGTTCLAPTSFTWQGSRDNPSLNTGVDTNTMTHGFQLLPGDFNGDGLTDALVNDTSCPTGGDIWVGSAAGTFSRGSLQSSYDYYNTNNATVFTYTGAACFSHGSAVNVGDFNGDGFTDVAVDEVSYALVSGTWVATGFTNQLLNNKSGTLAQGSSTRSGIIGMTIGSDFNGDGRTDGIIPFTPPGSPTESFIEDSSGTGPWTLQALTSPAWTSVVTVYLGDFDGDGCGDALGIGSAGEAFYSCNPAVASAPAPAITSGTIIPGDYNGDGLTDLLVVGSSTATIYYATGTGFTSGTSLTYSGSPAISSWHNYQIVTGDFNGDGKTDIALISHTSGTAHAIALSTGTGFTPLTTISNSDTTASAVVADWNNDGGDDLWLQFTTTTHDTEYTFAYTPEVITAVDGGLGAVTSVVYDRLNKNGTFYTKGTAATYPDKDLDGAYYVVKELDTPNGIGGSYAHTYAYSGATVDVTAPPAPGPKSSLSSTGFVAFTSMAVTDPQTNTVLTTSMSTSSPFAGQVSSQILKRGALTLQSVADTYTPVITTGTAAASELTQRVITRNDVDGTAYPTMTIAYTYDAYANPLTISYTMSGGSSRTVTNTFNNDTTHWVLGELATMSDQRIVGSSNLTRHYSFGYGTGGSTAHGDLGKVVSAALEPGTTALELDSAIVYDPFGNRLTTTLSGSAVTTRTPSTNTFDSVGRFTATTTDALSHGASYSYNADFGTVASATTIDATTTSLSYDTFGRATAVTNPDGTKASVAYAYCSGVNGGSASCPSHGAYVVTAAPLQTDGVTQNGSQKLAYYDALGRYIATDVQGFDGSWIRQETQFDANLHVGQTSRPYFLSGGTAKWTVYSYTDVTSNIDPFGRAWTVTAPDTSQTTYSYDALATTVTDANSHATKTTLNEQGLVASVLDAATHTTSYVYDAFNNLTKTTDPAGNISTATFDLRGRRTGISDPDRGSWSFSYDVLSELTSQTDAKSQSTSFTYDLLQRPFRRTETDLSSLWTYDGGGVGGNYGYGKPFRDCNASTCSGSTYQRTFFYDSAGRASKVQLKVDGTTYNYIPTYDSSTGRVTTVTYPSGFVAKYDYNSYGYLADIKDNSTSATIWTANARNAELQLTQVTAGNGMKANASFDANTGQVLNICATTHTGTCDGNVTNLSYTWDSVGNLTERDDTLFGTDEILTYDALDRQATGAINGGSTRAVAYDASGNITKRSTVCTTSNCMTYGSSAGPHALTGITGTYNGVVNPTFTYDLNGNMTAGAGKTFTWTSYNMPLSVVQGSTTLGFTYKPDHQRLKMCIGAACSGSPTTTVLYLNDPITGVGSEKSTSGSTVIWNDYIVADGGIVAERTNNMSVISTQYFTTDHLGSTVALTDGSAAIIEHDFYDPYGKRRASSGGTDTACALTSATTRGFSGHEMLDSVCLTNMNARLYDQTLGRFVSADSTIFAPGNGQNGNLYAYVNGRPTAFRDPTGNWSCQQDIYCHTYCVADCFGGGSYSYIDGDGTEVVVVVADRTNPNGGNGIGGSSAGSGGGNTDRGGGSGNGNKNGLCNFVPAGIVLSGTWANGGLGGLTFSKDVVLNFSNLNASTFNTHGAFVGWNGGSSLTASVGAVFGDLKSDNSGYSGGFVGASGSGEIYGAYAATSTNGFPSGAPNGNVTIVGGSAGVNLLTTPTGIVTDTNTSAPTQLGVTPAVTAILSDPTMAIVLAPLVIANKLCGR